MSAQPSVGHASAHRARNASTLQRTTAVVVAALVLAALGVLAVATAASAAPDCTRSWDDGGVTNSWSDPDNWDGAGTGQLPTATDHACIGVGFTADQDGATVSVLSVQVDGTLILSGGTLALTDTANGSSVATFSQSEGFLSGPAVLTIRDLFTWTGGQQTDAGRTVIDTTASATFDGPAGLFVRGGRTLENKGSVSWDEGGIWLFQAQSETAILNSGLFEATFDGSIFHTCCDGPGATVVDGRLHNTGTFRKSGGDGTTAISVPFDNDGVLEAASGTIDLTAGGVGLATGSFGPTATDSRVRFTAGSRALGTDAVFSDSVELAGATLDTGPGVTVLTGDTFTQSSGTLTGAGTLTVLGAFVWSGGEQAGVGRTRIEEAGTATIDAPVDVLLRGGRTFENRGEMTWSGGRILLSMSETETSIVNSGIIETTFDGTLGSTCCDGSVFDAVPANVYNTGTFTKTGGDDETRIAIPFDNDGDLEAESGAIKLANGGIGGATGTFASSASSAVQFGGGAFELQTGAFFDGNIELIGDTLTLGTDMTVRASDLFVQSGGTLRGTGTLNVQGSFLWTGGVQRDAGRTLIMPTANATIDAPDGVEICGGRSFENEGTLAWLDGGIVVYMSSLPTTIENDGYWEFKGRHEVGDHVLRRTARSPPPRRGSTTPGSSRRPMARARP